MLHKAVYWQLIVANPAERVQAPKARKPKRRSYDDEQTKILLENLENLSIEETKYKVAIILTVFTGVRLGELMGLEWQDVDFKNGIICINRSSQYLSDMGVFTKTPKTESSIREIAIPEFIISLLEEYKYGMKSKNRFTANYGLILIGYLYKLMANLCILLQLANGLLNM